MDRKFAGRHGKKNNPPGGASTEKWKVDAAGRNRETSRPDYNQDVILAVLFVYRDMGTNSTARSRELSRAMLVYYPSSAA